MTISQRRPLECLWNFQNLERNENLKNALIPGKVVWSGLFGPQNEVTWQFFETSTVDNLYTYSSTTALVRFCMFRLLYLNNFFFVFFSIIFSKILFSPFNFFNNKMNRYCILIVALNLYASTKTNRSCLQPTPARGGCNALWVFFWNRRQTMGGSRSKFAEFCIWASLLQVLAKNCPIRSRHKCNNLRSTT